MDIRIIARVVYISPAISHNKLIVDNTAEGIRVQYVVYDPQGEVRNYYDEVLSTDILVPGKMYALVEFWDGYTLIEHRPGTYDGIYGAHSMQHKATFAVTNTELVVLTNTPVDDATNVTFIGGAQKFWDVLEAQDPIFEYFNIKARTKSEIAARVDPHASIAALEAQVDLLTSILVNLHPENEEVLELAQAIGGVSLLDIKDRKDLLQDVKNKKTEIRKLQDSRVDKLIDGKLLQIEHRLKSIFNSEEQNDSELEMLLSEKQDLIKEKTRRQRREV